MRARQLYVLLIVKVRIMAKFVGLLFVVALLGVARGEDFKPGRVHLIDHSLGTNSFLFRTNEPANANRTFDYAGLVARMRTVANSSGLVLPEDFYMVDVNLLSLDLSDIYLEKKFFDANPSKGLFVHRPIFGSLVNPLSLPEPIRKELAKTLPDWSHDKLSKLMVELRTMLTQTYKNTVIFVHCLTGEDRTGEVSGAYYMTYLQDSFAKALEIDNTNENRDILCMSARELIWYCLYLQYTASSTYPNLGSCEPINFIYCLK